MAMCASASAQAPADDHERLVESFLRASPERWAEIQREQAARAASADRKDAALLYVEAASMALATSQPREAAAALNRAVDIMRDFQPAGRNRVGIFGAEQNKEWKGESYEKVAAFLYLGILYFQDGDVDNALAMWKSASIADAGTEDERYRGDFLPAYVLRAWAHAHENEPEHVDLALAAVYESLLVRHVVAAVQAHRPTVAEQGDPEELLMAEELLLDAFAVALLDHDDAVTAFRQAATSAVSQAERLRAMRRADRPPKYRDLFVRHVKQIQKIAPNWLERAQADLPAAMATVEDRLAEARQLVEGPPNVMLVVESGDAPVKTPVELYGSTLAYDVDTDEPPALEGQLDGSPVVLQRSDSLGFQATTRGGRKMDELNVQKAKAKLGLNVAGSAAMVAGDRIADRTGKGVIRAAGVLGGVAMKVASAAIQTEADARAWRTLPDSFYLASATLPEGPHALQVGQRYVTFEVGREPVLVFLPVRTVQRPPPPTPEAPAPPPGPTEAPADGAHAGVSPEQRLQAWMLLAATYALVDDDSHADAHCASIRASSPSQDLAEGRALLQQAPPEQLPPAAQAMLLALFDACEARTPSSPSRPPPEESPHE